MLDVAHLRCEYMENPIGLDCRNPHFCWKIVSDKKNVKQQQFQLQVSLVESFTNIIWNIRTFSEESIHICYEGPRLESRKRYFYRVKIWTCDNEKSDWSKVSFWEMGLLDTSEWKAEWITVQEQTINSEYGGRAPFSCSKEFLITKPVQKAMVYATSLGLYQLELNGKKVGKDYFTPGWTDYNYHVQYQSYEITDMLHGKENLLLATVGEGWYSGYLGWQKRKDSYGTVNALLVQIHITYEDGSTDVICSDESWREENCKILMSDIYNGEIYDACKEGTIKKNMIRLSYPKKHLIAQQNEPVRIIQELEPISIFKTPRGETVLDMGQNMVGWVRFKANGCRGQKLTLIHGEVLDVNGNFYCDNLRDAAQKITYVCKGSEEEFEPHFTYQGFRYVKLVGFSETIDKFGFKGVVLHSNMENIGEFETSDRGINQLQHNILWGQKGNFLDVPTDCPQRDERLGWTADAQIFSPTACFNMNTALFFRKWLRDLSCNQMLDGSVPLVVPDIVKGQIFNAQTGEEVIKTAAAWGDAAVICPWIVYLCYGDIEILREQYKSMKKWINYIRQQGENEYLWVEGTAQLGDWLALDNEENSKFGATDEALVATAYYAYSTGIFAETAKILGEFDDYKAYSELYRAIKKAYADRFFDKDGNLTSETQTTQVISLYFDLVPEHYKNNVIKKLVALIEKKGMHLDTGFVGTPYICHALSENGHVDVAYRILFQTDYPSWLYQVERGATTMWEHWDSIKEDGSFWDIEMNSFNHYAYGSVGDWMYKYIAGIDLVEAGYKKSRIEPHPMEPLSYAKATLETMYGQLSSYWKMEQGVMTLEIKIPHNTTALVSLPYVKNKENLRNKICNTYQETNFIFHNEIDSRLVFEVGSGAYSFVYNYEDNRLKEDAV